MQEPTRVTYLIGAGASANALPIINGMKDRMLLFIQDLFYFNIEYNLRLGPQLSKLKELVEAANLHYTIDTYAKKLWLKKDTGNYELLKRFLSFYLIYEQFNKNRMPEYLHMTISENIDYKSEIDKKKRETRKEIEKIKDNRYDPFFAYCIDDKSRNILKLKDTINIVSWNYDCQFEISYADFANVSNLTEVQKILQIFPSFHQSDFDENKSRIIKLNGSGLFFNILENKYIFDFFERDKDNLPVKIIHSLFDLKSFKDLFNELKFAWEEDDVAITARDYAKEIIGNSDVIVIVGYSFPIFNRDVDREIFALFNKVEIKEVKSPIINDEGRVRHHYRKIKKIYIQDKLGPASEIKDRLKVVGDNLYDIAEIRENLDQFYIPPEL